MRASILPFLIFLTLSFLVAGCHHVGDGCLDLGDISRVSVDSAGAQGDGSSFSPSISAADDRYVAFDSSANNLVVGDSNGVPDIFVHDSVTGETTRVSVDSAGNEGNDSSFGPSISADGRYVAFESFANNLVAGDSNGVPDIFVHDTVTGETTRVSVDSAGAQAVNRSSNPSISADGRYVAFYSFAGNLVAGDSNFSSDVFVHDTVTGETTRVSVDSAGAQGDSNSFNPSISADGRYVAFYSFAGNLVVGDSNKNPDIFVHDTITGETTRVSVDSAGAQAVNRSFNPSISADGRYVAFESFAGNLVAGDSNFSSDIFVHDTVTGETTRVSVDSAGNEGNDSSFGPSINVSGRYVAFASDANNLVAGDSNGFEDIFVHDTITGETTRVSVDSAGAQGDGGSYSPAISADGCHVAFESGASNLVAENANGEIHVYRAPNRP